VKKLKLFLHLFGNRSSRKLADSDIFSCIEIFIYNHLTVVTFIEVTPMPGDGYYSQTLPEKAKEIIKTITHQEGGKAPEAIMKALKGYIASKGVIQVGRVDPCEGCAATMEPGSNGVRGIYVEGGREPYCGMGKKMCSALTFYKFAAKMMGIDQPE
jgi:hypothetical protein